MGGGYYDRDVGSGGSGEGFDYQAYSATADQAMSRREIHPDLAPAGRILSTRAKNPIVVAMDVTRSRGNDSKIVYDKMPMLYGQIMLQGYLADPAISFAAIGDATSGDRAPLQVADFASGDGLDGWLTKIWLEEGGGGTGRESYELAAYFYARNCVLPADAKGIFFITGDEGFYPEAAGDQVARLIGAPDSSVDAKVLFRELRSKFRVFFIYPKKAEGERRADIDAEIAERLKREGGKSGDVRASLVWNDRNDLDLHVICPSGEEIFYAHKNSACGGELDVDMNVHGESMKPVENVYWATGGAPVGHYRVFVRNYAFHMPDRSPTPFRVELSVNGKVQHFEGVARGDGPVSDVPCFEFDYTGRSAERETERYSGYADEAILAQWREVLPESDILVLDEPKGIVDAMLGAIALASETRDLDEYLVDMRKRGQTDGRIDEIRRTLLPLAGSSAVVKVDMGGKLPDKNVEKRESGTKRL
ncbi:MAG: hypothetical protein NT080_07825 [Spirochaetes bacterium]|nr:hypothetical protein [Spirochaetota bacterium]